MRLDGMDVLYPVNIALGAPLVLAVALLSYKSGRYRSRLIRLLGGRSSRILDVIAAARIAAVILLVIASAAPYTYKITYVDSSSADRSVLANISALHVILVDDSKSMSYTDMGGRRIDLARGVVEEYLRELGEKDTVAIYRFHAVAEELCRGRPMECMNSLGNLTGSERYSALGTAIGQVATIASATRLPVIGILVSDGGYNYGPDPASVADSLGNTTVAIVRIGNDPRGEVLRSIAERHKWPYYHVTGSPPKGLVGDLAETIYVEAKARAVSRNGMIPVEERDYTPTWILAMIGALLLAASKVAGP